MLESLVPGSITQTILVGLVVALIVRWFLNRWKYNMPPGPLCLPIIGSTLQLGSDERYHLKFYEWSKKYGPVITVGLGPMKLVVVNDIDTAMEVLVKKSTDFAGRMSMPSIEIFTNGFKDIAFTQYGPTWKLHRKISSKALRDVKTTSCLGSSFSNGKTIGWSNCEVAADDNMGVNKEEMCLYCNQHGTRSDCAKVGHVVMFYGYYCTDKEEFIGEQHGSLSDYGHYMQGHALEERVHMALETTFPVLEKETEPFNPREAVNFLVLNIIMGLCFSGEIEYGNKDLQRIIKLEDELTMEFNHFIPEDMFPFLRNVFTSKPMRRIKELYQQLVGDFIERRFLEEKKTFNRDNIRHFTDTLLLTREDAEAEEDENLDWLTDDHLVQTLADIFFAGMDTSRHTLYFAILHMIAFPEIQQKVQEELDREIGKDRSPGLADRPNLGYTEAVLHESMRMATVVPTGLLHATMCDTDICSCERRRANLIMIDYMYLNAPVTHTGMRMTALVQTGLKHAMCDTDISGYNMPKGTLVAINHWALHHEPTAWDDVDKFIPERYLDENGRLGPKPTNWLPFSAGKRVCLGEFVAKPELHLIFAGLMQRFTWSAEQGVNVDIEPQGSIFAASPKPFNVKVTRR